MEYVSEASSSSACYSGQAVEEDYSYSHYSHPSSSYITSPSSQLADSYTSISDTRQPPYMETPSERRARLEFIQREREKEEIKQEDRSWSRVSSWVQNQVENSAFMVMAAATTAKRERQRSSGARKEPRIVNARPSETRSGSPLRFSHIPSDCEDDEDGEEITIPHISKSKYPLSSSVSYVSTPQSPSCHALPPCSSRTSKHRRRRRLAVASSTSSLDSIPEE
ncbi:hypothetical protein PM082_019464 [Marasmius tenuissimus]|nr:hypothetical protein PM082_019464 [Marasmius tenuissimus]